MDIANKYLVGRQHSLIFLGLPTQSYTRRDALLLAAWLVALADDDNEFQTILDAVRNT